MRIVTRTQTLTGVGSVLLTAVLAAQDRAPARDTQRKPEIIGSAVITGTLVTDDASARPIRRAIVNLSGSDFLRTRITVTDDAGRFTFTSLPAANYSVSANKAGYVTTYYGGKRPGRGPGVPIALADGQRVTVALKMARGAVLTGIVTDPAGRPTQAQVSALQYQTIGGERTLRPAPGFSTFGSSTDDRGVYRLYGLPPGEYIVSATVRSTPGDLRPVTPEEIHWARQFAQTAGGAPTAGLPAGVAAPPPLPQTVGYASIYYPGTGDASAASAITLAAGEERTGVDIPLQLVPTSRIEGTVTDAEGRRANGVQVMLLPKTVVGVIIPTFPRATTGADGRFVVAGIAPGDYALTARGRGAGPVAAPASGRVAAAASLWAVNDLTVSGQDISGLELRLEPGMVVAGRFEFESATNQTPANVASYRAGLGPWRSGTGATVSFTIPSVQADAEGRFRFPSVSPGTYSASGFGGGITGPNQTPAWILKSVTANGRDVTDQPLEIRPREEPPEIVITFTDKVTEITGTLLDPAGRPTSGLSIIVVPVNREFWNMNSRRIRPVTPASDGKFKLAGLPPGEYYMAAVTDYEYTDLYDASFLEQLTAAAFKITLGEGEKKVQDIRMGGG
ncbi:MAG: carboxypeptidase regulatory-like domain-containing protein [Acidobacteriota bacterium]